MENNERQQFEAMLKPGTSETYTVWEVLDLMQKAYDMPRWIDTNRETPKLIEGKDYSENVLAIINGQLGVACYFYFYGGDREESGYAWGNCYDKIDGDCEWDDDYEVTLWQPLPELPHSPSNVSRMNEADNL